MYARATTTITILRGLTVDDWGDPVDTYNPVQTGVRASIIEYKVYAKGEVTTQPKTIRYARLRVTSDIDIRINDRVKDEKHGNIWVIQNISSLQNPAVGTDRRIDLQLIG